MSALTNKQRVLIVGGMLYVEEEEAEEMKRDGQNAVFCTVKIELYGFSKRIGIGLSPVFVRGRGSV
jgi:hypothetical protein